MKINKTLLVLCIIGTMTVNAQEVDKATVTTNAEAGKTAVDDLKKADSGEKAWKFDGVVGINAAATGLVNWAAGGQNNVNGVAYAKLHLLYHKDAIAWETNFDTEYGMTYIDQEEDPLQKSSDNIKLATKFGWEFHKNWYLTVLGSFNSQYALGRNYVSGYNPVISKWLAPSHTDISVGIDYKASVNGADFSVYLSPVAGRIATAYIGESWNKRLTEEYISSKEDHETYEDLVASHLDLRSTLQDKYGVAYYKGGQRMYDRNFRAELGLSFKGAIAYKYENLTLGTTLELFTPYAGKGEELASYIEGSSDAASYFKYSNMNRSFGHFDVDWDVAISYQFLKVLNVTLSTSLKYYNGTLIDKTDANGVTTSKERVQFKSVLGLGIGYSF